MTGRSRGPRPLDRGSPLPLWAQLLDDLVRRLEVGALAPQFPSEHDLAASYGVSRHTVREALRRLRDTGVISSHRGRLTVVGRPGIEQPLGALYSLFREVEGRGMVQHSEVLARDVRPDAHAAAVLGLPADTGLVYVERLRRADGEPLAWDRAWLPVAVGERLLTADLTHSGLYDELRLAGVVLTGGKEHIESVVLTAATRRLLQVPAGVAALSISRTGRMKSRPVEWRQSLVRGDRFSLSAEWSTTRRYRLDVHGSGAGAGAGAAGAGQP